MVDGMQGRGDGGWNGGQRRWWMEQRVEQMVDGIEGRGDGGWNRGQVRLDSEQDSKYDSEYQQ